MRRFLTIITGESPTATDDHLSLDESKRSTVSSVPSPHLQEDGDDAMAEDVQSVEIPNIATANGNAELPADVASNAQHEGEDVPEATLSPSQRLSNLVLTLRRYSGDANGAVCGDDVIGALKDMAEVMVWADQHDPNLWDVFLEYAIMPLFVRCLRQTQVEAPGEADRHGEGRPGGDAAVEISVRGDGQDVQKEVSEALGRANGSLEDHEIDGAVGENDDDFDREFADVGAQLEFDSSGYDGDAEGQNSLPATVTAKAVDDADRHYENFGEVVHGGEREVGNYVGSTSNSSVGHAETNNIVHASGHEEQQEGKILLEMRMSIQAQILQTISIVIQSVNRKQSLLCLFSSNHINNILSFGFAFEQDEMLAYFISAVKSISLKLDENLLQLFFDPAKGSFPLYTAVISFFDHPEYMVRIAVRNVTLTIYALGDSEVLKFAAKDEEQYFLKTTELLAKLCGSVARTFELILDDGREVRRTRSRTGIFRRMVKIPELSAKLEEIENMCAYLGEVSTVSQSYLYPLVVNLISSRLFSPFFRPLASQASPEAMQLLHKQWRLSRANPESETRPAIPLFDAAARCLVLACVLTHCKTSPLGRILIRDLCRPTSEFEHRHVLHGLKAMATDITGTERVTFISLCAIEAFVSCEAATRQLLTMFRYDFYLEDEDDLLFTGNSTGTPLINIGMPDEDDLERRGIEPLLMTLSDFDAPLTPNVSRLSTPTLPTMASMASMGSIEGMKTPPNGSMQMDSHMSSFDSSSGPNLSPQASMSPAVERSDSDGILSAFQLGEATLREAISSVVLVVRRREVRTLRVMHRVAGIISVVQKRSSDMISAVDVTKIILDELAGVVDAFMKNKRTTIVSIEQMFDNFRSVAESGNMLREGCLTLDDVVSPEKLPQIASAFPKGTGKRRRVHSEEAAPPVEIEDAQVFFLMSHVYDDLRTAVKALNQLGSLSKQLVEALTDNGVDDSYLEKRDALETVSHLVLKHGEVG